MSLPDGDPVYTLKKVMEDLDFSGLLANCSDKGRTGYNRVMMYAVITYTNMRGIRSIDRIVDLCERDIAFIWLTQGRKPHKKKFKDKISAKGGVCPKIDSIIEVKLLISRQSLFASKKLPHFRATALKLYIQFYKCNTLSAIS